MVPATINKISPPEPNREGGPEIVRFRSRAPGFPNALLCIFQDSPVQSTLYIDQYLRNETSPRL